MKIAAIQIDIVKRDKKANLQKVRRMLAEQALDLAVLPELFATGYFFADRAEAKSMAEAVPQGETTQALCRMASEFACHIIGCVLEEEADQLYLSAVVVGPQGYLGKQRKRHLTEFDARWYSPGEESVVFDIMGSKVGVLVCFDAWFPESARELTLRGAQIICQTALISSPDTMQIMRVRAIENKTFVVVGNATGEELYHGAAMRFRGESRVIDFLGNILQTIEREEGVVSAEVTVAAADGKAMGDCTDLLAEIKRHRGLYQKD